MCCKPVVAPPRRKIAARHPGGCTVAGGTELPEARLGCDERSLGLVEPVLLEQRAAEHELRAADLVDVVLRAAEQPQRMPRLLLGLFEVAGAQMNLGERRYGACSVAVAAGVEPDGERFLEQPDCRV